MIVMTSSSQPQQTWEVEHKEEFQTILKLLSQVTHYSQEQIRPHLEALLQHLQEAYEEKPLTPRLQAFHTWVEAHHGSNLPVLSDEATSRESIYGDRG